MAANLLIPRFSATRVNIGPVAATVGSLFWGWLWGVMGLLLAVPLTAFVKLVADLYPSLCHVSSMLALTPRPIPGWVQYGETAWERAIPYLRGRPGMKPRGSAGSADSAVLMNNAPPTAYVGGHMTHFVLLVALAVLIFLYFASRRRARA